MTNLYARAKLDGSPVWSDDTGYGVAWNHVADELRFHKGAKFKIDGGPDRTFSELEDRVKTRLDDAPELTVVRIKSNKDGFEMGMRRDHAPPNKGQKTVDLLLGILDMPYELGWWPPQGKTDCSGSTMWAWNKMGIDGIPHKAQWQADLFGVRAGFVKIPTVKAVPGDVHFIDLYNGQIQHVAVEHGAYRGHPCVVDAEPHDTNAPWGGMLGTGVQIRPRDGNYYCSKIVFTGRIVELNGKP